MKIERNNYEVWFIDYLEGRLDNAAIDDFIEFIQQNPDLKEELSLFEVIPVVPESLVFEGKKDLYKNKYDDETEFNEAAIGRMEGDLAPEENREFEEYLSLHPNQKKKAELFFKTRLNPDHSVIYPKRKSLYRQGFGRILFLWSSGVAAILIVALAIFTLMERPDLVMKENRMAKTEVIQELKPVNPDAIQPEENKNKTKSPENNITEKQKPEVKKPENGKESKGSLRENNRGRLDDNDVAFKRTPEEVPSPIKSLVASVSQTFPDLTLAGMHDYLPEESLTGERLLADVFADKTGIEDLSLRKITRAGLSLFSNLSGEKFTYETDENGKITGLNYDSRLLAFTIPTGAEE